MERKEHGKKEVEAQYKQKDKLQVLLFFLKQM